jgi:hypothetical protein
MRFSRLLKAPVCMKFKLTRSNGPPISGGSMIAIAKSASLAVDE